MNPDRSSAPDPDGPEAFEATLMDGLENEPPYPQPAEETVTYLGYPIRNRHGNHLTVMTPAGFVLFAGRVEMAQAQRIIRIHRGERRHP